MKNEMQKYLELKEKYGSLNVLVATKLSNYGKDEFFKICKKLGTSPSKLLRDIITKINHEEKARINIIKIVYGCK